MDILVFFPELLLEVLFAAHTGKLQDDAKGESSTEPVSSIAEDAPEFTDCAMCGKPNPLDSAFCGEIRASEAPGIRSHW
jgi:hypothetical protein